MNRNQRISASSTNEGAVWSIGADAPLQSILERTDSPPLFRQALTSFISWQTRNETPVRRALAALALGDDQTEARVLASNYRPVTCMIAVY